MIPDFSEEGRQLGILSKGTAGGFRADPGAFGSVAGGLKASAGGFKATWRFRRVLRLLCDSLAPLNDVVAMVEGLEMLIFTALRARYLGSAALAAIRSGSETP